MTVSFCSFNNFRRSAMSASYSSSISIQSCRDRTLSSSHKKRPVSSDSLKHMRLYIMAHTALFVEELQRIGDDDLGHSKDGHLMLSNI